jgi:ABC-2 type transport system permease protein
MRDIATVVWKELKELVPWERGNRRGLLRVLFVVGFLGVIWPLQAGPDFVLTWLGAVYAAFAATFQVTGLIPDSFAGERERHTLETLLATRLSDRAILLGKVTATVVYGSGVGIAILLLAAVVTSIAHNGGRVLFYPPLIAVGGAVLSALGAALAAGVGVLVSLRAPTVKQAQQILTAGILVLAFLPVIAAALLPERWRFAVTEHLAVVSSRGLFLLAVLILSLLDALFLLLAVARFRRDRLLLD